MICSQKQFAVRLNFYVQLLLFVAVFLDWQSAAIADNNAVNSAAVNNKETVMSIPQSSLEQKSINKAVISPEKFSGEIAAGYKAAQKARDICSKLFCYCGCDLTDEHVSLLDCFTSMHGVDCAICQEEAIIALHMKEQRKPLGLIQKTIDEKFAAQYPWEEPSLALQKYLKTIQVYQTIDKNNAHKISQNISKKMNRTKYNTATGGAQHKKRQGHCCGH